MAALIQQGVITIRTTRSEILKYQSKLRSENAPIKGAVIWAIKRTRALNRNERLALEDFLDKVFSAAFVDVKRPEVVATLRVKRPIRKVEREWFGDIRRQLVDLGYVEIDDKFGKAGLKHQEQQNDAVREALKKAISNADSSSRMWSSEIANLPDRMIKTLLAPMGIDFDSLKAEAHKTIKEPALLSAVEKDQSAEAHADEALPVETKRTDTGVKFGKPPKE